MSDVLNEAGRDLLFRQARTHNGWTDHPVADDTLREFYDLLKFGPTSVNSGPTRIVFIKTPAAKERLLTAVSAGNQEKTRTAPVTAIVAHDLAFYDKLGKLFPHADAAAWFRGNDALIEETAFRNSSLQGAYMIMAARAVGLDCGPMSGFDRAKVDAEFFAGTSLRSNFLCNLGYGDASKLYPRAPRLEFEEACSIL